MKVVIVESPAKAKTINKYLGKDYDVYASFGHVRDLAAKDGSVDPDDDFAMRWEVDAKAAKRLSDIGVAVKGADRVILATDPDREGEAISWHIHEILKSKKRPQGQARRPRGVQRRHQGRDPRGDAPSARDRRGAGRRLPGAPRARLSRRLHPLAGAVAQAARRAFGRPRAVGRAAHRLRPRARDRKVRRARILVDRRPSEDASRARPSPRGSSARTARRSTASTSARARRRKASRRRSRRAKFSVARSNRSRSSATPTRPSPPRRCSRRPRASSASRRPAPCRSPSASTKASTSATGRPASSPICAPTASTSRPRRSRPRAASSARTSATPTCPARRANIPPRPRTRRKRTRRSVRPT